MFLFEGKFGRILYTGDFRYSGPMLNDEVFLTQCTSNIDLLYVDNTYLDPKIIFPSHEEALVQILDIIRASEGARVMIGMRNLGKEKLLIALARHLHEYIGVSEDRYKVLEIIQTSDVFKVSPSCRIQVVDQSQITKKNMEAWNFESKTIAIIPTALSLALGPEMFCQHSDLYVVPYSDHCCFQELIEFVQMVEPNKVMPILSHNVKDRLSVVLTNRSDMSYFVGLTNSRQPAMSFLAKSDDVSEISTNPVVLGHIDRAANNIPGCCSTQTCQKSSSSSSPIPVGCKTATKLKRRAKGEVFVFKKRAARKGVMYDTESPSKSLVEEERLRQSSSDSKTLRQSSTSDEVTASYDLLCSPFPIGNPHVRSVVNISPSLIMNALEPLFRQEASRLLSMRNGSLGTRTSCVRNKL